MKRFLTTLVIVFTAAAGHARVSALFTAPSPAPVISAEEVGGKYQDAQISGFRPVASGAGAAGLNERFDSQYADFLKRHAAGKMTFSVTQVEDVYHSVLFSLSVETSTDSEQYAAATVIDKEGRVVALRDVVGVSGVKLINKDIAAQIAAEPKLYNTAFSEISGEHDFYVEGNAAVILFGEFELLAAPSGVERRAYNISDFKTLTLTRSDYATAGDYAVKIVPLRQVADAFGFTLNWDGAANTVAVLNGGASAAFIKIGDARYAKDPGGARRALETAPELRQGRTFVPVSFCEEFLSVCAKTEANGDLTLTAYTGANRRAGLGN